MGHSRPRYNVKGRLASQEKQQQKRRKLTHDDELSTALIITDEDRARARAQLLAQRGADEDGEGSTKKLSSKQKKRLDAFVQRSLKKDARRELLASLAQTQAPASELAKMQQSAQLGSKRLRTASERDEHREQGERARAHTRAGKRKRVRRDYNSASEDDSDEEGVQYDAQHAESLEIVATPEPPPPSARTRAPAPPLDVSGTVGVVDVVPGAPSTSNGAAPSASASAPAVAGSALAQGTRIQVIKRAPRAEKGKLRDFYLAGRNKKDKQAATSESDDESLSEDEHASEDDEASSEYSSWGGIRSEGPASGSASEESDSSDEGSESSGEESESVVAQALTEPAPRKAAGFREWATSQVRAAAGIEDDTPLPVDDDGTYKPLLPAGSGIVPAREAMGPLGAELAANETPTLPFQRVTPVPVSRTPEIEASRAELPIVKEEDRIMEAIRGHAAVVICGETGSGKTTQIGQFLWENGWADSTSDNPGMVAITQPRRVAALSTAARVRTELNLSPESSLVAHRIRYSSTTSPDSKLVFMTDGVLLRELASDFLLRKYSAVVVDEAHERSVNTDVLIGVLSRVIRLREQMWRRGEEGARPLRLIIMSATLRVSDFVANTTLFPRAPPLIEVNVRQHPVTMHFARRTSPHYLEQAYKKVARIHARLPPGGILVFLTGQNEIVSLCKKLEDKFGARAVAARKAKAQAAAERAARDASESSDEDEQGELGEDIETEDMATSAKQDPSEMIDLDEDRLVDDDPEGLESDDEDDLKFTGLDTEADTDEPLHILPLYSLLPTEKQTRVFADPPPGTRLVVVATNVAETSVTIPNIRYVVDAGRAKERTYDLESGVQSFEVQWVSKASASQRSGRAGRTGPGHCYRLYSSAVFDQFFEQHAKPEIMRTPIDGVVLQMKAMNIDSVANFPFPTPPDRDSLRRAEIMLVHLQALESGEQVSAASGLRSVGARITDVGRAMASFPLSPRFAKMLVSGQQHGCLPYVIALTCGLTVGDPFLREDNIDEEDGQALTRAEIAHIRDPEVRSKEERRFTRRAYFESRARHSALGAGTSDVFRLLSVIGAYEYDQRPSFCERNFVRPKAMQEIHKLRLQISNITSSIYPGIDTGMDRKLKPPTDPQLKVIRQLITAAYVDQIAVREDVYDRARANISYARMSTSHNVPYRIVATGDTAYVHASSVFYDEAPPEFVVFQEVHRSGAGKLWLKTLTKVNGAWLPTLGRSLCAFSKKAEADGPEALSAAAKAGLKVSADTRACFVTPRFGPGAGVELKPVLALQRRVNGRWIIDIP